MPRKITWAALVLALVVSLTAPAAAEEKERFQFTKLTNQTGVLVDGKTGQTWIMVMVAEHISAEHLEASPRPPVQLLPVPFMKPLKDLDRRFSYSPQ